MAKKKSRKNLEGSNRPDIKLTEEQKRIPVSIEQRCRTLPKVKCPVKGGEYCVYNLIQVTPGETDYACPACGEVVKKDVFTAGGWKTLVLDRRHEL